MALKSIYKIWFIAYGQNATQNSGTLLLRMSLVDVLTFLEQKRQGQENMFTIVIRKGVEQNVSKNSFFEKIQNPPIKSLGLPKYV